MTSLLPILVFAALAFTSPVRAQEVPQEMAAQVAPTSGDLESAVTHLEAARSAWASGRADEAQLELSAGLGFVRAAGASASTHDAAGGLALADLRGSMPGVVKRVPAKYPVEAAKAGVTGQVAIDVVIDEKGRVRDAKVAHSIPGLDRAALQAVKGWRFAARKAAADLPATVVLGFTNRDVMQPGDEIALGLFYIQRRHYSLAEQALNRALDLVSRDAACFAMVPARATQALEADTAQPSWTLPVIKQVKPRYPAIAMREKVEGIVVTEAIVDLSGRVRCARVLTSIPLLDQAAIDALQQWEFSPMVDPGGRLPVRVTVSFTFSLR